MNVTLDVRMGLTEKALASAPAFIHLDRMRASLAYLPLYAEPMKAVATQMAMPVLSVIQSDPANFPVRFQVDLPAEKLEGRDHAEKIASGQKMIRESLSQMDMVLNGEAFVLE